MDYLFLAIGLSLLLLGANYLVDSSVAIAKRANISNFIIGLTIVGMGTSAPELFISDIAMGNVIGSNIGNIFLILGVAAAITPFAIERQTQRRDIPFGIFAALMLLLLANDSIVPGINENTVSRIDGIFFLILFIGYMCYVIFGKAKNPQQALADADDDAKSSLEGKNVILLVLIAVVSLAALIYGGNTFLDSAKNLAHTWGLSDAVISITIVAIGTSLPELITAIVAACKHNPQLALGNVLGSNVFNILLILGTAATVKPLKLVNINIVDYLVVLVAAVMTYLVVYTFKKRSFDRIEGFIFIACYIAYTAYLLIR